MSDILQAARELQVPANTDRLMQDMATALGKYPREELRKRFGGGALEGYFYLYADESKFPGVVFECVISSGAFTLGERISAVYVARPEFATIGELLRFRRNLINHIADKIGLSAENIGIEDPARGRDIGLAEMATGQLADIVLEQERGGLVLPTLDNRGIDRPENAISTRTAFEDGEVGKSALKDAAVLVQQPDGSVKAKTLVELGDVIVD